MLLYRAHSIAYHHVCNTPAIDISPQNQWPSTMQWLDFFHALKIHTPII